MYVLIDIHIHLIRFYISGQDYIAEAVIFSRFIITLLVNPAVDDFMVEISYGVGDAWWNFGDYQSARRNCFFLNLSFAFPADNIFASEGEHPFAGVFMVMIPSDGSRFKGYDVDIMVIIRECRQYFRVETPAAGIMGYQFGYIVEEDLRQF